MPGRAETTGERIRRLRKEAFGETYRAADKATGISISNWANWETKGTQPYGQTLIRLAAELTKGLGRPVTVHEILTGETDEKDRDEWRKQILVDLDQGSAAGRRRRRDSRRPNGQKRQEP